MMEEQEMYRTQVCYFEKSSDPHVFASLFIPTPHRPPSALNRSIGDTSRPPAHGAPPSPCGPPSLARSATSLVASGSHQFSCHRALRDTCSLQTDREKGEAKRPVHPNPLSHRELGCTRFHYRSPGLASSCVHYPAVLRGTPPPPLKAVAL